MPYAYLNFTCNAGLNGVIMKKTIASKSQVKDIKNSGFSPEKTLTNLTALTTECSSLDQLLHSRLSHFMGWMSPAALLLAYSDWLIHLSISPEKWLNISQKIQQNFAKFCVYAIKSHSNKKCTACVAVRPTDHRFQSNLWQDNFPFNLYSQFFLLNERIWDEATTHVCGVTPHHENIVNFTTRQMLDIFSPSNFPWTNPEVIKASYIQTGMNFIYGHWNYIEDVTRYTTRLLPAHTQRFQIGKNIAITKGQVIYRNQLIELIQYSPTTTKVYAEPILIIPAWIMKYYILDLSEHNSMIKYLVDQGHTVFMISWKNPTSKDRHLGLEDYVDFGIMAAIQAINAIIPGQNIHSVGYCIGGTLLMLAAAVMATTSDERLKTITLFAAQVDFKEAGELLLFIDESQIAYLEDVMSEKGYLDGAQMAGAFSMLNSIDLIWSRYVQDYLLGKRPPLNDLMAWNSDTTRLPYKMHSEYLRQLFLNNELVRGQFKIHGIHLSLLDINAPIFVVSTMKDHVAPWKSVYKIHEFTTTDITYILTNGGHNSGIINEPNSSGHSYQMLTHKKTEKHIAAETWQEKAPSYAGSWWPAWEQWLTSFSEDKIGPPPMGNPQQGYPILCAAPGTYVFQQ